MKQQEIDFYQDAPTWIVRAEGCTWPPGWGTIVRAWSAEEASARFGRPAQSVQTEEEADLAHEQWVNTKKERRCKKPTP